MKKHHWYPSKYNRRFTNYSIEIIIDPSETPETINISEFVKVKSIWGSTMASCFGPSHEDWLANHLVDHSIISSSIYQYINSLLELGDHTAIRQELIYFIHNVFPASIKPLLISSAGEWISYNNINMNLQHKAHMAIKFIASTADSDVEDEELSTKRSSPSSPVIPLTPSSRAPSCTSTKGQQ
eukprot:1544995-Amphidinium_carterae.1